MNGGEHGKVVGAQSIEKRMNKRKIRSIYKRGINRR